MAAGVHIKYSCRDMPTIQAFMNSNARIRAIKGPFRCLPGDTEYLSPEGWRRMDMYREGDLVAQWWPSGQIEFVKPCAYVVDRCDEVIEFDSGSLVMRLTPDHRVPHYNWNGRFGVKTAARLEKKPSKHTIPTTFDGHAVDGLGMSDDMIRFAVMIHADGHFVKSGKQAVVSLRKERKKERLRALLGQLGISFNERVYKGRPTESVFSFIPPYRGKRFDGVWWRASQRELAVVLDEMRHWDGHCNEVLIYNSSHKIDSDFIQYAAHANGLRATISKVTYANPNWQPSYMVHIRMSDNVKNRAMVRVDTTKIKRVRTPDGKVYCFTVPSGFFLARCDDTIFVTGNSGKSSASVAEIVRRGLAQRPGPDGIRRTRWIVVRNTFSQLEDSTIQTVHMWLPPAYFGKYTERDHTYTIKAFENTEIEIWFRALDRPDHVRNLLSVETTGAWFNEAREIPWAIVEAMDGRIGQYPAKFNGGPSWTGMWLDTNPPDTDSKFYKFFEETKHDPARVAIFNQPSGLSPEAENLENLNSATYYQDLAYGKSPEWIKVYIKGEYGFVAEGQLVYPEYQDAVHCRDDISPVEGLVIYRVWDFGLCPACLLCQEMPNGQLIAFDEMTASGLSLDKFADDVLDRCQRSFRGQARFDDIGDPTGEARSSLVKDTDVNTAFKILQAKNINIRAAVTNEPALRQESVRRALSKPNEDWEPSLLIHSRCKALRKGFLGGYHRRRIQASGPERYSEDPVKNHPYSDVHDCLQYFCAEFMAPILTGSAEPDDDFPDMRYDRDFVDPSRSEETGY